MTKREIRKTLKAYFGDVRHDIRFVSAGKRTIIDIEYEDFLSEQTVEHDLHHLIGEYYLLNIKRECSDKMMEKVFSMLQGDRRKLFFHLVATVM